MGLCGYNEKIGAGILALVDGMIHAMVTKELAEIDFQLVLKTELEELQASNEALMQRPDSLGYLDGFLAINRFAQVLFERAFIELAQSNTWSASAFSAVCKKEAIALTDAMRDIDGKHRSLKTKESGRLSHTLAITEAIVCFIEENHRNAR